MAKKPTGRPPFKPTAALRRKVSCAAAGGMSHEEIAIGLGITRPTLEKHFASDLSHGAYARRIEALDAMCRMAKKGNVTAQKALLALNPTLAATPLPKDAPKPAAKGKKEQANEDAVGAEEGTGWGGLLPAMGNVVPIRT